MDMYGDAGDQGNNMNKVASSADRLGAQSVDRALAVLALIGRSPQDGVGLSVITDTLGLNRPTARRLLLALIRAGLVEQDPATRAYALGSEAYVLGVQAARRHDLTDLAAESLVELAGKSGDTAFLSVRRDAFAVCLLKQEGSFPIRTDALQIGERHPLGVGAGSLAMLAALPVDEAAEILDRNAALMARDFPGVTPGALTPLLDRARADGWALNPGLVLANSWAVGVALRFPDGRVAGSFSIAAIDSRMQPDRQQALAAMLKAEAARVEARLARRFGAAPAKPAQR